MNETNAIIDLATLKKMCAESLFEIATGSDWGDKYRNIKIRYIGAEDKFYYTSFGHFFFFDDCMYLITSDERYSDCHNPDISGIDERLDILNHLPYYIARVIFAGFYTGFEDDNGERIFTGDVVSAKILINPDIQSKGGRERAKLSNCDMVGSQVIAAVNTFYDNYHLIMDNCSVPLSWAVKLYRIGSVFFDLDRSCTEVGIQEKCARLAQWREDKRKLHKKIVNTPSFILDSWQEIAIKMLTGE